MSYGRFRLGRDVFWMMRVEPAPAMRFMETRHERPCWRFMHHRRTEPEPYKRNILERGT